MCDYVYVCARVVKIMFVYMPRAQIAEQQRLLQQQQELQLELLQYEEEEARNRIRQLEADRQNGAQKSHTIEESEILPGEAELTPGMSNKRSIPVKTQEEQVLALKYHALAGLQPGDSIVISRDNLPGALLFPALVDLPVADPVPAGISKTPEPSTPSNDTHDQPTIPAVPGSPDMHTTSDPTPSTPSTIPLQSAVTPTATPTPLIHNHRYLVITSERLIVLNAMGGGIYVFIIYVFG